MSLSATPVDTPETLALRARLVERLRSEARVTDARVLEAFAQVPRHHFLPDEQQPYAYEDRALPLSEGQTISQPSMIAIMLECLACQSGDRALEVGAGCGYAAALLAQLVAEVHTIEVRPALAARARENLETLGIRNVQVHCGDGRFGLTKLAPFQRILVSAGAPEVPVPLLEQLDRQGRIVIPLGDSSGQTLHLGERTGGTDITWIPSVSCIFVPLVPADQVLASS